MQTFPETHGGVHTVTVTLADGRVFTGVEVAWAIEVIRVHGHHEPPFSAGEVASVEDASSPRRIDYGVCDVCGQPVVAGSSFIDTRPTDWNDPRRTKTRRWVPVEEDIHGWSPFVLTHPGCFAAEHGVPALVALVDESHRLMRQMSRNRG